MLKKMAKPARTCVHASMPPLGGGPATKVVLLLWWEAWRASGLSWLSGFGGALFLLLCWSELRRLSASEDIIDGSSLRGGWGFLVSDSPFSGSEIEYEFTRGGCRALKSAIRVVSLSMAANMRLPWSGLDAVNDVGQKKIVQNSA